MQSTVFSIRIYYFYIFRLQKLLGHSNLDIVKEYVNMFGRDLTKDYTSFNPLDTLGTVRTAGKIGFGK